MERSREHCRRGKAISIRGQLKCDGTRAETRFRLSAKRTSPFKSAGLRQFSRLLAAEVCASAVVMLDTPCSEVVWRVLATHSIRQFPLHFPARASPCAITFQTQSIYSVGALVIWKETCICRTILSSVVSEALPYFSTLCHELHQFFLGGGDNWTKNVFFLSQYLTNLMHKICFTISLFHASTCFEHMCSSSGGQNYITQPLVSSHL